MLGSVWMSKPRDPCTSRFGKRRRSSVWLGERNRAIPYQSVRQKRICWEDATPFHSMKNDAVPNILAHRALSRSAALTLLELPLSSCTDRRCRPWSLRRWLSEILKVPPLLDVNCLRSRRSKRCHPCCDFAVICHLLVLPIPVYLPSPNPV